MILKRMWILGIAAAAAVVSCMPLAPVLAEPGEGGMTTMEACSWYLKNYMQGEEAPPSPEAGRPCFQGHLDFIIGKWGTKCPASIQKRAEEFRVSRCGGTPTASPQKKTVAPRRLNAEPSCLKSDQGPRVPCDKSADMTIVVTNLCNRATRIKVCLKQTDGQSCASSAALVQVGKTFTHRDCKVTGDYTVSPR